MPDLTDIFASVNDIERELEIESGGELILTKNGVALGDPIPSGWFPPEKVDQRFGGGKKFYTLSIFDVGGAYSQRLAVCDGYLYNNRQFKIIDKEPPIGDTREWILEAQPTGGSPSA